MLLHRIIIKPGILIFRKAGILPKVKEDLVLPGVYWVQISLTDYLMERPAIGKQVKVMGRRLTVVGVFKKEGEDMLGMSQDKNVLIPINLAKSII